MVEGTITKIKTVNYVDGDIKAVHPVTKTDVKRALEKCSDKELDELLEAIGFERARRYLVRVEADEEIALDALYD